MRKLSALLGTAVCALLLSGCAANRMGVTPSQNTNLQEVSPSQTAASQGGAMQRGLDSWLTDEWIPFTASPAAANTPQSPAVAAQSGDSSAATTAQPAAAAEQKDETPFGLQKYVDKWKVYNEKKAKMEEGKPKEPSTIDKINSLPVIGK